MKPSIDEVRNKCTKIRELWGNKNSTWDEIVSHIGMLLELSLNVPQADNEEAQRIWETTLTEWQFRGTYFIVNAVPEKQIVERSIRRFLNGDHYHVTFKGAGIDISDKFNDPISANNYADKIERGLKKIGKTVGTRR